MRRRTLLGAGLGLAVAGAAPAFAAGGHRVVHVRPGDSVQAAVEAVTGPGWTIVVHPGTYREVIDIPADKAELTVRGAVPDPRAAVIVFNNANGTQTPDGSGTYGTAGSATFTSAAPGLTVRDLTLANDWLRADHPDITGTQAVAACTYGGPPRRARPPRPLRERPPAGPPGHPLRRPERARRLRPAVLPALLHRGRR